MNWAFARVITTGFLGVFMACGGATGRDEDTALPTSDAGTRIEPIEASPAEFAPDGVGGRRNGSPASGFGDALDATLAIDAEAPRRRDATGHTIRSGTRTCDDARECFGFSCERALAPQQKGTCVLPCVTDEDCDNVEDRCLDTGAYGSFCVRACRSPVDCEIEFHCADFYDDGQYTCLPATWIGSLPDR